MKTKIILLALATVAIVSISAARFTRTASHEKHTAQANEATIGGFASEDK